jgi:predicted RNA binding protein YcfA (HicA-like mRNA interferase family)
VTRRDKLIAKLRRRPPEVDFDDVRSILIEFGWTEARVESSHHSFTKPGEAEIFPVPVHRNRVKRHYVDRLCEFLGLDDDQGE